MKTQMLIAILIVFSLSLKEEGHAAGIMSNIMYRVYVESYSKPETFDMYIDQNRKRFDEEFFACTERLLVKYAARAKEHADWCRGYTDTQMHQNCMAQNIDAQFGDWLLSTVSAVKNGTPWCKTSVGSFFCSVKQYSEIETFYDSLFPGLKEKIAQEAEPLNRLYLTCD